MRYLCAYVFLFFFSSARFEAYQDLLNEEDIDVYTTDESNDNDYMFFNRTIAHYPLFIPSVEYAIGKTIGIDGDYGHFGLLIGNSLYGLYVFAQAGAYILNNNVDDGRWAYSIGGVVRYVDPCCNRAWGINSFYDYRQGCLDSFYQVGIGLESLSYTWDLRVNAYFPFPTCKKEQSVVFDDYEGDFFASCQFTEFASWAVNAEIGRWICLNKGFTTYQGVNSYFLSFQHYNRTFGVLYRGLLQFCQWLAAEAIISYDSFFHTRVQGLFRITFPFKQIQGCWSPTGVSFCNRRVERFDMIILSQDCCWTWNW